MIKRWNVYIPLVQSYFSSKLGMGYTYETPKTIKPMGYYFNWGASNFNDPNYIPHAFRSMNIPWMGKDYNGYVLVHNEPENKGQSDISPEVAAERVIKFAEDHPLAKLIVGGYGYFGQDQFPQFIKALGSYKPTGFHVHGYVEKSPFWEVTFAQVTSWWERARESCEGELWITEFADTINGQRNSDLLQYIYQMDWIDRAFWFVAYTGASETRPWWFPEWWTFDPALFYKDGSLTPTGKLFKEYQILCSKKRRI